jgi:hypothetical protein
LNLAVKEAPQTVTKVGDNHVLIGFGHMHRGSGRDCRVVHLFGAEESVSVSNVVWFVSATSD